MFIVRKNRSFNEDAGRKLALRFFDALGTDHELTIQGRRRLQNLLFV